MDAAFNSLSSRNELLKFRLIGALLVGDFAAFGPGGKLRHGCGTTGVGGTLLSFLGDFAGDLLGDLLGVFLGDLGPILTMEPTTHCTCANINDGEAHFGQM